jgi:hypothetical protein
MKIVTNGHNFWMGTSMHKRWIGFLLGTLSLTAIAWTAYVQLNINFWCKPHHEKLAAIWTADTNTLLKSKKLPKEWNDIKDVVVKSDNSPLHEWLPKIKPPIPVRGNGHYRLEAFFVLLLEGNRYGTVVEYNLIEIATANTVWELGRTYKLGLFY